MRLQGLGATEVVDVVRNVLAGFEGELKGGSLITVKARKTTCHRRPVGVPERRDACFDVSA